MLQWMLLALMPIYLVTGCGDLEPEMQDTRTVILKMGFDQRSSSRTSRVDPAELINYKTHLIMVLTSDGHGPDFNKNLSNSSYWDYRSNQGEYVLYDSDREITLNMKLNTKMKIFAFLFSENYSCSRCITGNRSHLQNDLFSANRDAGYYGESQIITIDSQTANIPLKQVSGTDPAGGDFGGDPGDFGGGDLGIKDDFGGDFGGDDDFGGSFGGDDFEGSFGGDDFTGETYAGDDFGDTFGGKDDFGVAFGGDDFGEDDFGGTAGFGGKDDFGPGDPEGQGKPGDPEGQGKPGDPEGQGKSCLLY